MKSKRMYSHLMIMLMVMLMICSMFLANSEVVMADSNMKYLKVNQTTLEFKEIIYVDGTTGNDETGDGSNEKPFATVVKGFDYMNENCREEGAIVVKSGAYSVKSLFNSTYYNLDNKFSNMKVSIIAEQMGTVTLDDVYEWIVIENNKHSRIKICFYGIIFGKNTGYIHLGGDDWGNEYTNCVFPAGYTGWNLIVKDAKIIIKNCIFTGTAYTTHANHTLSGESINSATIDTNMQPSNGVITNYLHNAVFDSDYNITSEGWQNAGIGTNPDGSQAHIGVYGGQFAWGSKIVEIKSTNNNELDMVLEVDEKLILSVDDHLTENINMTWSSSDESVATVDHSGTITALKEGESIITAKAKNGKYMDTINILVVEDANDFRLAIDLNIGESARATIDKNRRTATVTWTVADDTVVTVSSKGKITAQGKGLTIVTAIDENGKEVGQVYVRVR